jgi:hypothetical protein
LRQLLPGIRTLRQSRLVTTTQLADDLTRALPAIILRPQFGLGTDALQFGFPRLNVLLLFEGDAVNPVLARVRDPIRVVRIHLRLRFLFDRRLELGRLVNDREAVFIDRLLVRLFERLFIDRNDLATRVCTRYWNLPVPEGAHAPDTAMLLHRGFPR